MHLIDIYVWFSILFTPGNLISKTRMWILKSYLNLNAFFVVWSKYILRVTTGFWVGCSNLDCLILWCFTGCFSMFWHIYRNLPCVQKVITELWSLRIGNGLNQEFSTIFSLFQWWFQCYKSYVISKEFVRIVR